jgi:hypothetical protein
VLPCGETRDTGLKHPLMSGIADARCACDPVGKNSDPRLDHAEKAAVSPLQPYSSKEEAQSAGPDSWAGHAANSGITALLSKSNAVNPSAWTTCRALAAPRPRRSECHPRRIAGVAARQGLLLHADSHYVDPVSSRKRVPAPTGLAEHAYTNMHIQQWDLRVIPAACCAPAAFKRSAMHQARLERVELPQADHLAARLS